MIKTRYHGFWLVPSALLALVGGCQTMPGPEAVLAGTWELTVDSETNGTKTILKFDSLGKLIEVGTQTGNVTVTDTNATGTVTVVDKDLTIKTSTNLRFEGTFNDAMTEAKGTLFTEFNIFGTITSIDMGPATMKKVS